MSWLEIKSPVQNGKVSVEIPDTQWGDELATLLSAAIPPAPKECHPEIADTGKCTYSGSLCCFP